MTQLTRYQFKLDKLVQISPQLAQELKTRVKLTNTLAWLGVAIAGQFALVILALGKLPDISSDKYPQIGEQFSRYCTGAITHLQHPQQQLVCLQDFNNHWLINWQLFWFDIFAIISFVSIALLTMVGTYLIMRNLRQEQQQGTLQLITLAPQPAINFFIGKVIGAPILLYIFIAAGLPLQLVAGLQAGIPLSLLIAFDLAIIASCAFFYSLGLWGVFQPIASKNLKSNHNRVALVTVAIACFLVLTACLNSSGNHNGFGNVGDWLLLCNPLNLITYLGQITAIPIHYFNYDNLDFFSAIFAHSKQIELQLSQPIGLANLAIYGQSLQQSVGLGLGVVTANFLIGAYWFWQGIKRRFYNSGQSSISKEQSYWLSFQVALFALGLTLNTTSPKTLITNFGCLSSFLMIFGLILIFSLSPSHYELKDWLHNRQTDFYAQEEDSPAKYSLWQDLILGESSPANLAIALNLLIISCYVVPSLIIFPSNNQSFSILSQLVFQLSLLFLFATLWQWLNLKHQRTQLTNKSLLLLGVFVPSAIATNFTFIAPALIPGFIPFTISLIAQLLAIILITRKTMHTLLINTKTVNNHQKLT